MPGPIIGAVASMLGRAAAGAGRNWSMVSRAGMARAGSAATRVGGKAGAKRAAAEATRPKIDYGKMMMHGMSGGRTGTEDYKKTTDNAQKEHDRLAEKARKVQAVFDGLTKASYIVTGGLTLVGAAFLKLPGLIKAFGDSVIQNERKYGMYSGTYAGAQARYDLANIRSDMKTAQQTSGSGKDMTDAVSDLTRALQPIEAAGVTVKNAITEKLARAATVLATIATAALELPVIRDILDDMNKGQGNGAMSPGVKWVKDLSFGKGLRGGRPPLPPVDKPKQ